MGRTVIAAVDDMLFASKVRAVAEHLDIDIRFARNSDSVLSNALQLEPALIVVDLQSQKIDAIELAKALKANERLRGIPLLGFFSHVLVELQRTASEAGFDRVLPRSVFSRDLAGILAGDSSLNQK
jgi:chemosensory pili system protein ChpA (sensor histidine kinase/response regulator)